MSSAATKTLPGFHFVSRDAAVLAEACVLFAGWDEALGIHGEFREFAGHQTYFKAEPLRPWTRLRHGARHIFLRRPYPRLAEFENLEWLASHDFHVPRPLLAGVRRAWDGAHWQFLVTERLHDLQPLVSAGNAPGTVLLETLAAEVARMHELGFIHRDLHLRNLAWRGTPAVPEIVFFDAWRGGARLQSRGVAYDLACLMNGLAGQLGEGPVQSWLERYLTSRFPNSSPERQGLIRGARRQRARL